jgi:phosphoribosylamine--glycine ligase
MKTNKGIKLIEYNVRFGDPEAMNVLPLLKNNFIDICWKIIEGNLPSKVEYHKKATVCKYLAPEGYPINPKNNQRIIIHSQKLNEIGAKYYYASVYKKNGDVFTTTSRSMGILGIANSLQEAEKIAEKGVGFVEGNLFHRKDIGTLTLLNKRKEHMENLLK